MVRALNAAGPAQACAVGTQAIAALYAAQPPGVLCPPVHASAQLRHWLAQGPPPHLLYVGGGAIAVCCQAATARLLKLVAQQRVAGCLRCYPLQVSCYCVMLHLLRAEGLPLGGVEGHPGCPHRCRDLRHPWRPGAVACRP